MKLKFTALLFLCGQILAQGQDTNAPASSANSFPVSIVVDAGNTKGELRQIWRFFGADEPNYAYMTNGSKLIGEFGKLGGSQVYFRCHHLLTSGDGWFALKWGSTSAYKEDAQGNPLYDFSINDRIFDTYLARGVKPYAQIGFMPEALSSHPQNYPHNPPVDRRAPETGGQSYPPKDYAKWGNLAYEWAKHCVERYGAAEVNKWYWEVWNEPNIFYWHMPDGKAGTVAEYCKLYDYAVEGVRRALPTARVGGPETAGAGGNFMRQFLTHCESGTNYVTGQVGSPLDFISFHAKGAPVFITNDVRFTNNHVRMGIANQLTEIDNEGRMVAAFPKYKNTPLIVGESDPDGCAACTGDNLGYRNGVLFASYTAASYGREQDIAESRGANLEGALTWAFEFENEKPFAGHRVLATDGIDLPVFNVFRMLNRMSGQRIQAESDAEIPMQTILRAGVRGKPDVGTLASLDGHKLCVMVWHYHDDDVPGPTAQVSMIVNGLPMADGQVQMQRFEIDETHSDAFAVWQKMGSPAEPSAEQYTKLEAAGQLADMGPAKAVTVKGNKADVSFELPRQAITLFVFTW
jgi:xylan 1,4-beta-xylosidase